MKAKTQLSLTQTGAASGQEAQERRHKQGYTSWKTRLTRAKKQRVIKPGLGADGGFSVQRAARVEALRAQVKAGTYEVDSRALAKQLLSGSSCDAPGE